MFDARTTMVTLPDGQELSPIGEAHPLLQRRQHCAAPRHRGVATSTAVLPARRHRRLPPAFLTPRLAPALLTRRV